MTKFRFIWRSLWFHARGHLGAFLGAAVGATVLVGALGVGDSVRGSLRELAALRLGHIEYALSTGDRLFTSQLANGLQQGLAQASAGRPEVSTAAEVLQLPAVAVNADGSARANQVQVHGVDARFWALAPDPPRVGPLPADALLLNRALAGQLRAGPGDTVLLRVRKPQALSADAPLAPEEDTTVALRLRVQAVLEDREFGRFGLAASQVAPFNAFVSLPLLQTRLGATNRANLLLAGQVPVAQPAPPGATIVPGMNPGLRVGLPPLDLRLHLDRVLTQRWQLADAQIDWVALPAAATIELRSPRVFLDALISDAVFGRPGSTNALVSQLPNALPAVTAAGVLTYFVNELRHGDRATPYSMVTATEPPLAPPDLADDEILITQWLADDLNAGPGDTLSLRYYIVGTLRQLEERTATFRVRGILPMNTPGLDPGLMPDFPGMTDAENCRDWDTGLPIDSGRIRPKDEDYWRDYRGTPKAVVSLRAGQALWANRFGNLTAVRFHLPPVTLTNAALLARTLPTYQASLNGLLARLLQPRDFGLQFVPVAEQARAASDQSQDFGQLFLGFSFFLIAAALLLLAVLFQFSIEQRATEIGTLLAVGFRPGQAGRLLWMEAALVALAGCALGAWGGTWYAQAMLHGLSTIWSEAVGGTPLRHHLYLSTLVLGIAAATLACWGTLGLALARHLRVSARQLLAEGAATTEVEAGSPGRSPGRTRGLALLSLAAAAGLVGLGLWKRDGGAAGLFFGAGALLLLAGLAGGAAWLDQLGQAASAARLSLRGLGVRSATRRRRRSLAVVGLLACGSFLVASIGVFRLDAVRDASRRTAGTGGFALIGECTQPVVHDLNQASGQETLGLEANDLRGVTFVPFRVRDGDDASCLNLNRAQVPRLLGVRPEALAERGAFTFASTVDGVDPQQPWLGLKRDAFRPRRGPPLADDEVPAIGDLASIRWALGKQVGDTLDYTDERGRAFKVRLVGAVAHSILQGNLIVDEAEFVRRYPSASGYRYFLVDTPPGRAESVAATLTRELRDFGLEMTPTMQRLAAFNAVQNTYLGTFQALGGLGLLLGSVGLGAVVLRNVFERRNELALLLAVGFRARALRQLILSEHVALLVVGLGVGVLAALVAVMPSVWALGAQVPYRSLALTLLTILLNGVLWTALAAEVALRGHLLAALRNT